MNHRIENWLLVTGIIWPGETLIQKALFTFYEEGMCFRKISINAASPHEPVPFSSAGSLFIHWLMRCSKSPWEVWLHLVKWTKSALPTHKWHCAERGSESWHDEKPYFLTLSAESVTESQSMVWIPFWIKFLLLPWCLAANFLRHWTQHGSVQTL